MCGQKQQQSSPEQEPVGTDLSSLNALAQVGFLQAQGMRQILGVLMHHCYSKAMEEALSRRLLADTPPSVPKIQQGWVGGSRSFPLWMSSAEAGRDSPISPEGAGLGTGCPAVTLGGCCAWVNVPCSLPALWFV